MTLPIYMMPLCDCADKSATCLGRQEGKVCMAHDPWFDLPCSHGKCPGFLHHLCCNKGSVNTSEEE